MNDDELTAYLEKMLSPREPSRDLMQRLCATQPQQGRRLARVTTMRRWVWAAALPAAAAAVALAVVKWADSPEPIAAAPHSQEPVPAAPEEVFLPVELRQDVVHAEPGELIQLPGHPPLQLIRVVWRDQVTAVSAHEDATLELERYREAYVPVVATIY